MPQLTGFGRYVIRRLLLLVPLLFGITVLCFFLVRLSDVNPATLIAGPTAGQVEIESVEEELGLGEPLVTQYWIYLRGALTGDLGESWVTQRPVGSELAERLPITLELVTLSVLAAAVIGIAVGFVSAMNQNGLADHGLKAYTLVGVSMPVFWLGLLLIFVFFYVLGVAPAPTGRLDLFISAPEPITNAPLLDSLLRRDVEAAQSILGHMVLPAAALTLTAGSAIAKQSRSAIIEIRFSPRVRYARACGLPQLQVWRLILHNALPSIITFVAIDYSFALGGSALIEIIFSWGGLGQFGVNAITRADYAVVQAFVLTMGVLASFIYLVSDLVVAAIDPRVSYR